MLDVLKLVRIQNLAIIALTQYVIRHAIISPILRVNNLELQLSHFDFSILVLATLLTTAAGYVINDYFDTRTDLVNRPSKVLVGKTINRRTAIILHMAFSFTGILFGFYVAFRAGFLLLGVLFIIVFLLLWFYSTTLKRQVIVGNVVVSVLTGMVPLVVLIFEMPALISGVDSGFSFRYANINYMVAWTGFFAFFAFLLSLIREIIKDIEDFEGDRVFGRKTLPIVVGITFTKLVVAGLIVVTLISLGYIYIIYLLTGLYGDTDLITFFYFLMLIAVPLLVLLYKMLTASGKKDYIYAKNLSKVIMLAGIMYAFLVRFIILQSL